MRRGLVIWFLLTFAHCGKQEAPQSLSGTTDVRVHIRWNYRNFPLRVAIHEIKGQVTPALWETRSVKDISAAPIGEEIPDGVFAMQPGKEHYFILVVKNTTTKPAAFFAAPHHLDPPEASLGFQFKCLCVNHLFTVDAGQIWYRVVRLRLARENAAREITVEHSIVGSEIRGREGYLIDKASPEG